MEGALRHLGEPIVLNWELQYMRRDRVKRAVAGSTDDTAFYLSLARRLKSRELDASGLVQALGGSEPC
jgi:hypothetical protein